MLHSKSYADDCWNRWVFRRLLKSAKDDAEMTSVGRLLRRRWGGGDAVSTITGRCEMGTTRNQLVSDEADRRGLVPFSSFLTLDNIVTLKSELEVTQCH